MISQSDSNSSTDPPWFYGPEDVKLCTSRWLQWGFDNPAIWNSANWILADAPKVKPHPNHGSAHTNMHLLVPEINRYIDQFLVEPYNAAVHGAVTDFVTAINPWGAILKPDGEIRPLMDPTITGVNAAMAHWPVVLPQPKDALRAVTKGDVLGKRDLRHGFHHIILAPAA